MINTKRKRKERGKIKNNLSTDLFYYFLVSRKARLFFFYKGEFITETKEYTFLL